MALHYNKKIYLLNDIYPPYKDELEGWNVIPLKGNLDGIEQIYETQRGDRNGKK